MTATPWPHRSSGCRSAWTRSSSTASTTRSCPSSQSTAYAGKAKEAGDEVTVITVEGADHFDVIDPAHRAWKRTAKEIAKALDD